MWTAHTQLTVGYIANVNVWTQDCVQIHIFIGNTFSDRANCLYVICVECKCYKLYWWRLRGIRMCAGERGATFHMPFLPFCIHGLWWWQIFMASILLLQNSRLLVRISTKKMCPRARNNNIIIIIKALALWCEWVIALVLWGRGEVRMWGYVCQTTTNHETRIELGDTHSSWRNGRNHSRGTTNVSCWVCVCVMIRTFCCSFHTMDIIKARFKPGHKRSDAYWSVREYAEINWKRRYGSMLSDRRILRNSPQWHDSLWYRVV